MSYQESTASSPENNGTYSKDVERIIAVSGPNIKGRSKARVLLNYYEQYYDGTRKDIRILPMEKPIVHIFKGAGFTNVFLDFGSVTDMDLRVLWETIEEYRRPSNSVSYLPEELERGYYETPEGPKAVYFPVLALVINPIGKEDAFAINGYNPAFITLAPNKPNGEACVVQFTFLEETFSIVDEISIDYEKIDAELQDEQEAEKRGYTVQD